MFLRWGGLAAWLMVGVPVMIHPHESPVVLLVLSKLGARDRTQAVLSALELGLL